MSDKRRDFDWNAFQSSKEMRMRVLLISMFIAAYEHLKDSIISQARSFYTVCNKVSPNYRKDVLKHHKKKDCSTLIWIKQNGGVGNEEIKRYERLTKIRNEAVHEYVHILTDSAFSHKKFIDALQDTISLLEMIEEWFIMNSADFAIWENEAIADGKISPSDEINPLSPSGLLLRKLVLYMFEEPEG